MLPALLPAAAVNAAKQHKMKPAAWLSIVHSAPGVLGMGPAPIFQRVSSTNLQTHIQRTFWQCRHPPRKLRCREILYPVRPTSEKELFAAA
jgi:hypothetical protein